MHLSTMQENFFYPYTTSFFYPSPYIYSSYLVSEIWVSIERDTQWSAESSGHQTAFVVESLIDSFVECFPGGVARSAAREVHVIESGRATFENVIGSIGEGWGTLFKRLRGKWLISQYCQTIKSHHTILMIDGTLNPYH